MPRSTSRSRASTGRPSLDLGPLTRSDRDSGLARTVGAIPVRDIVAAIDLAGRGFRAVGQGDYCGSRASYVRHHTRDAFIGKTVADGFPERIRPFL